MNEPATKSPVLALILGFAPSALALIIVAISGQDGPKAPVLWLVFLVSVGCCFTSSVLLFRRKTGLAIAGGIVFLLLNGGISFFTGCLALFNGMR